MPDWTVRDKLIRLAIAVVWLYHGLWCKVLGGVPRHRSLAEPAAETGPGTAANWAAVDRSLLWGVVQVSCIDGRRIAGGRAGDPICSIG